MREAVARTALSYVERNRGCAEPVVRTLVQTAQMTLLTSALSEPRPITQPNTRAPSGLSIDDRRRLAIATMSPVTHKPPALRPGTAEAAAVRGSISVDDYVPAPRLAGATFGGNDQLAYFSCFPRGGLAALARKSGHSEPFQQPRSLEEFRLLMARLAPTTDPPESGGFGESGAFLHSGREGFQKNLAVQIGYQVEENESGSSTSEEEEEDEEDSGLLQQDYKLMNRASAARTSGKRPRWSASAIQIIDASYFCPMQRTLAQLYVLPGLLKKSTITAAEACNINAWVAKNNHRPDLYQMWSLAGLMCDHSVVAAPSLGPGDARWADGPFGRKAASSLLSYCAQRGDVQMLAMLTCMFSWRGLAIAPLEESGGVRFPRENASSGILSPVDSGLLESHEDVLAMESGLLTQRVESVLLDPSYRYMHNMRLRLYSDMLLRWGLLQRRAEILKFGEGEKTVRHHGVTFALLCPQCTPPRALRAPKCPGCNVYALSCAICRCAVRGNSCFCQACGHGGHSVHIQEWFLKHSACPTGCGCRCLENMV